MAPPRQGDLRERRADPAVLQVAMPGCLEEGVLYKNLGTLCADANVSRGPWWRSMVAPARCRWWRQRLGSASFGAPWCVGAWRWEMKRDERHRLWAAPRRAVGASGAAL